MTDHEAFEIFLSLPPGLEPVLLDEALACGFSNASTVAGGVVFEGVWADVWRANLVLRGAGSVLARFASFRAPHLANLDKRARKVDWPAILPKGAKVRVEAVCRDSRIYHTGAARQRVAGAICDALGATLTEQADFLIKVRIIDDLCTLSLDTSGEPLHKRGHKKAVGKAPMRETLASLLLRACGQAGGASSGPLPVLDPMCGSGTFVIEAACMAKGQAPGLHRGFAFEALPSFNRERFMEVREGLDLKDAVDVDALPRFFGCDRDAGAIQASVANAERAGVAAVTTFKQQPLSALEAPSGPGLVIVNPPYGGRVSKGKNLADLYAAFGNVMRARFAGWRIGLVTNDLTLSAATKLPFDANPIGFVHGGIKVKFHQCHLG